MRLIKCSVCDHVIDVDDVDIEELGSDYLIGCGKKEGKFLSCEGCLNEFDPDQCESIRKEYGYTKTLVGEILDN